LWLTSFFSCLVKLSDGTFPKPLTIEDLCRNLSLPFLALYCLFGCTWSLRESNPNENLKGGDFMADAQAALIIGVIFIALLQGIINMSGR
jgi:hypothetical protein